MRDSELSLDPLMVRVEVSYRSSVGKLALLLSLLSWELSSTYRFGTFHDHYIHSYKNN